MSMLAVSSNSSSNNDTGLLTIGCGSVHLTAFAIGSSALGVLDGRGPFDDVYTVALLTLIVLCAGVDIILNSVNPITDAGKLSVSMHQRVYFCLHPSYCLFSQGLLQSSSIVAFVILAFSVGFFCLWVYFAREHPHTMSSWREAVFLKTGSFNLGRELVMGKNTHTCLLLWSVHSECQSLSFGCW